MTCGLILDTETTDKEPPMEVIELAWTCFTCPPGNHSRLLFKPSVPPKFGAMATHHILMEDLEGREPSQLASGRVPEAEFWIGHNIDFDWRALGEPPKVKRICTLALARRQWPELDSHNLSALTYFIKGARDSTRQQVLGAHSALDDVWMCRDLLNVLIVALHIEGLPNDALLERLWAESEDARVPRVMTFGKFRGQPVSAVDRGYMNWYSRQPDPDPYVLEAFRRQGW